MMLVGMFGTPVPVTVFEIVTAIATLGLVIGAVYLGGGAAAVRRQIPQITLMVLLFGVAVVVLPLILAALGDSAAVGIGLIGLTLAMVIRVLRGRAREPLPAARPPGLRILVAGFVVVMLINLTVLVLWSAAHSGR